MTTFEITEKRFEEMPHARNGPAHTEQPHPALGIEICHVRVVVGESEAPLDLHRPQPIGLAKKCHGVLQELALSQTHFIRSDAPDAFDTRLSSGLEAFLRRKLTLT